MAEIPCGENSFLVSHKKFGLVNRKSQPSVIVLQGNTWQGLEIHNQRDAIGIEGQSQPTSYVRQNST